MASLRGSHAWLTSQSSLKEASEWIQGNRPSLDCQELCNGIPRRSIFRRCIYFGIGEDIGLLKRGNNGGRAGGEGRNPTVLGGVIYTERPWFLEKSSSSLALWQISCLIPLLRFFLLDLKNGSGVVRILDYISDSQPWLRFKAPGELFFF